MKRRGIALLLLGVLLLGLMGCKGKKTVELELPGPPEEIFSTFSWPKSEIAKLIPKPESNVGRVEWEASYGFVIYVGNTTQEQYAAYVDACWDAGFTEDYRRGDDFFWADNEDGYQVTVRYEGNDIMFIRMDEPDEPEPSEEPSEEPAERPAPEPTQGPSAAKTDGYGVGETGEVSDLRVTLKKIEETKGELLKAEEGKTYLICYFDIENNSDADVTISSLLCFDAYVDSYATSISLSAIVGASDNSLDGTVAAGKKLAGVVGYEVPVAWSTLEIKFKLNLMSKDSLTFVVNK